MKDVTTKTIQRPTMVRSFLIEPNYLDEIKLCLEMNGQIL